MSESLHVNLTEVHHGEEYDSSFELDSDVERKKTKRKDLAEKQKEPAQRKAAKSEFVEAYSREEGRAQRYHLLALDAYSRHKKLINDYILYYKGSTALLKRDTSQDRTDLDIIRENHRFLWSEEDNAETWGQKIAKKYYDKLFKEYAISDLSRYKENKIALRWRIEKEVIDGKGQFICGNKSCTQKDGLRTWEVNFAYVEEGEKKNSLVKLRLCSECSYCLNYYHQQKEINAKRRKKNSSTVPVKKQKPGKEEKMRDRESGSKVDESSTSSAEDTANDDNELWKGPAQVEDKSREEEFEEYFEDLFL